MIRQTRTVVILFLLLILGFVEGSQAKTVGGDDDNPFVLTFPEEPLRVKAGENIVFDFTFEIPAGHYLYQDKLAVEILENAGGIDVGSLDKPPAVVKMDPFLGEEVSVYFNQVSLYQSFKVPPAFSGSMTLKGRVLFQGCSADLCYRPMKIPFEVTYLVSGEGDFTQKSAPPASGKSVLDSLKEGSLAAYLQQKNYALSFLAAFIGGVLSDLTPCVWPMIPVTLVVIGVRRDKTLKHNLLAVLVMILGMAVMYSMLGVTSALLRKSLGFLFQQQLFLWLVAAVMIIMGLSLMGLFEVKLPSRFLTWLSTVTASGYRGVFVVGFTLGILAAPCVGPIMGSILVYVAQTQDVIFGFWLLLFYALGMGTIFFVVAALYRSIQVKSKSGTWLLWLKRVMGLIVISLGVYYASITFDSGKSGNKGLWASSYNAGITLAKETGKPVVIDFYAQWCLPCKELDHLVWQNQEVMAKLGQDFVAIHIDCTTETEECTQAVDQYKIIGWPSVLFLDDKQNELTAERLVGKVINAQEMLLILDRVLKK